MTLIYLNREYSTRVYVSYRGRFMRLAILKYGRIPRIVADEEDILRIVREMKEKTYAGDCEACSEEGVRERVYGNRVCP